MTPDLDSLLDMIEPVLDHDLPGFPEAVGKAAGDLRRSGLVAREATDREVVVAGLLAYATAARAQGYEQEGLLEEIEGPLTALLGEQRARTLLSEWQATAKRQSARPT